MIELKNVCSGYEGKRVLHHVNAVFESGKVTVLVGPNGCGKSTLLKSIVRIAPHSSGEILVGGMPVEKMSTRKLAQNVAYLAQNKKAPDISVIKMVLHGRFAYLNYPRKYRPQDYEIAKDALEWAGMSERSHEIVSKLSGGMQQKVYIAMALAQENKRVLLIDCDFRKPAQYKIFGAKGKRVVDLPKVLSNKAESKELLYQYKNTSLYMSPCLFNEPKPSVLQK